MHPVSPYRTNIFKKTKEKLTIHQCYLFRSYCRIDEYYNVATLQFPWSQVVTLRDHSLHRGQFRVIDCVPFHTIYKVMNMAEEEEGGYGRCI